jgi:hypothetical protein
METSSPNGLKHGAGKMASAMKNGASNIMSKLSNPGKLMEALNENFAAIIINILLIVAIVLMVWNYFYTINMEPKECKEIDKLYPSVNGKISSITTNQNSGTDATNNYTYTFKDYYIKTAYNACSLGQYSNNVVSTCVLKDLIKSGVRGFDFEIYSLNNAPIVSTSTGDSYFVKETFNSVKFADVLTTIQNFAYSASTSPNPNDPIVLHLRVKSNNQKMYTNMANMFEGMDDSMLGKKYSFENGGKNLGNVPLLDLVGKIVIIVDKSNPAFMENEGFKEYVNMTSNSVFMRTLKFTNGVKYTPDMDELKSYNKQNMSIVLPDDGANPDNPSGLLSRALGCQMVAMRYQSSDASLLEDTAFFDTTGHAFSLKPANLRYIPVTIPAPPPPNPALSYASRSLDDTSGLYSFKI